MNEYMYEWRERDGWVIKLGKCSYISLPILSLFFLFTIIPLLFVEKLCNIYYNLLSVWNAIHSYQLLLFSTVVFARVRRLTTTLDGQQAYKVRVKRKVKVCKKASST